MSCKFSLIDLISINEIKTHMVNVDLMLKVNSTKTINTTTQKYCIIFGIHFFKPELEKVKFLLVIDLLTPKMVSIITQIKRNNNIFEFVIKIQ